jgi:hypothetical protein
VRRSTDKFLRRAREAKPIRAALLSAAGKCEICGHSPRHPWRNKTIECSQLCVHEIARGPCRQRALDQLYAVLVVCGFCHELVGDKSKWPEARQLAVLRKRRPQDYELAAYLELTSPRAPLRIEPHEVEEWLREDARKPK